MLLLNEPCTYHHVNNEFPVFLICQIHRQPTTIRMRADSLTEGKKILLKAYFNIRTSLCLGLEYHISPSRFGVTAFFRPILLEKAKRFPKILSLWDYIQTFLNVFDNSCC